MINFNDLVLNFADTNPTEVNIVFEYSSGYTHMHLVHYGINKDGTKIIVVGSMASMPKRIGLGENSLRSLKNKFDCLIDGQIVHSDNKEGLNFSKKMRSMELIDFIQIV